MTTFKKKRLGFSFFLSFKADTAQNHQKEGVYKLRTFVVLDNSRDMNSEHRCSRDLVAPHRARVSLISLLIVVLTEVPRVSVI